MNEPEPSSLQGFVRRFVTPPCDLCSDVSVVTIRAAHGCTCLSNVYQRRCCQHLHRASDTLEDFEIVEDYTAEKVFSPPLPGSAMGAALWLQVEMAAKGCVSGTLREWPTLNRALKELGHDLPPATPAATLRDLCKSVVTVSEGMDKIYAEWFRCGGCGCGEILGRHNFCPMCGSRIAKGGDAPTKSSSPTDADSKRWSGK